MKKMEKEYKEGEVVKEEHILFFTKGLKALLQKGLSRDGIDVTPSLLAEVKSITTFMESATGLMEKYLLKKEHMSKKNKSEKNKNE